MMQDQIEAGDAESSIRDHRNLQKDEDRKDEPQPYGDTTQRGFVLAAKGAGNSVCNVARNS